MTNSYNGIFLDRDGVINEKRDDYVKSTSELKIFPSNTFEPAMVPSLVILKT